MNTRHHYLSLLRTFALATLTAAAVAACTDDNGDPAGNEPITPADGIPVTFTANINPGSDADPDTRTVLESDGNGGFTVKWKGQDTYQNYCDLIRIWAVKGTDKVDNKIYVPTTSDASSELKPWDDGNKLTLTKTGEWEFTAVCGTNLFSASYMPEVDLSIQLQSAPGKTEHIAEKDFSVATAAKTVADNSEMPANISFKFKHMLSALQLQVKNGTGEALTVREIRLSVKEDQITNYKLYDVAARGWQTGTERKSDYLQLIANNFPALATGGTAQNLHMLLFPEPAHGGTDMTITVITDRGEYTLTKPAPSGGFLAGKNYLTDITIKSSGLQANETWTEYITSKADLIAFRNKVNGGDTYDGKTVRLTADIDLGNNSWTPIGNDMFKIFKGTFDGGGHHISGLNVNIGTDYAGLFGHVEGGTVRNLRVSGKVTTTGDYAGGIAGQLYTATVENCLFDGTVNGKQNVGGIAGKSRQSSRITGCYTKGKVTATMIGAAGIAGWNDTDCVIESCYSEAVLEVPDGTGGIAGNNNGTISHCYATGAIIAKGIVGGIAGNNYDGTVTGGIALNPSLTRKSGDQTTFGRILGNANGTIDNCAAFDGMKLTDATSSQPIANHTGADGTALLASTCLTKAAYTTDRGFTEATATTPGWAFDSKTTWTYLPWNKAFEKFSGIQPAEYRISVPQHIKDALIIP